MEARVAQLERNGDVVSDRIARLTDATEKNTVAIQTLTNMLSYNKGAVAAAFKTATMGTSLIAAILVGISWLLGFLHIGPTK